MAGLRRLHRVDGERADGIGHPPGRRGWSGQDLRLVGEHGVIDDGHVGSGHVVSFGLPAAYRSMHLRRQPWPRRSRLRHETCYSNRVTTFASTSFMTNARNALAGASRLPGVHVTARDSACASTSDAEGWIASADIDLDAAHGVASPHHRTSPAAAYHCQQADEKLIKAILVALRIACPRDRFGTRPRSRRGKSGPATSCVRRRSIRRNCGLVYFIPLSGRRSNAGRATAGARRSDAWAQRIDAFRGDVVSLLALRDPRLEGAA